MSGCMQREIRQEVPSDGTAKRASECSPDIMAMMASKCPPDSATMRALGALWILPQ